MRIATSHCELPGNVQPTSAQAVSFKDGMIITAEDLDTATRYPLTLFQTLIRAYFGCGIVCGLEAQVVPGKPAQPAAAGAPAVPAQPSFLVCIKRGVALGCDGYPIELCKPVQLDLTPDPCREPPLAKFCIAIRRYTSDDAPRADCGCQNKACGCRGGADTPSYQCARIKEHVIVQVFEDPPPNICMKEAPRVVEPDKLCACLTECPDCDCSGDPWILLGDFTVDKNNGVRPVIERSRRKFVKPTQCVCDLKPK